MLRPAYSELFLNRAMITLGDMFDYAINDCGVSASDFIKMFLDSRLSVRMEKGEAAVLLGRSGIENAMDIISSSCVAEASVSYGRSCEYWCGWAVCYYQWKTCRKYSDIFKALPISEMQRLYGVLHEAPIEKVAEVFDGYLKACFPDTALKRLRTGAGFSQKKLAELSGVSLRSIQMYEQRNKDINKASAETLFNLSRVFGVPMEDLLEYGICESKTETLILLGD